MRTAAEYVSIDRLLPWLKNPRVNEHAVDDLVASIKRFGFGAPIVARRANGEVIAGHTRLKAAQKAGLKEVPVRYMDLSEAEAHAFALADNKLGEKSDWDFDKLADALRDLGETDLSGLGFAESELNALLDEVSAADVKWKQFDETIAQEASPRPSPSPAPGATVRGPGVVVEDAIVKCPHCGGTFKP